MIYFVQTSTFFSYTWVENSPSGNNSFIHILDSYLCLFSCWLREIHGPGFPLLTIVENTSYYFPLFVFSGILEIEKEHVADGNMVTLHGQLLYSALNPFTNSLADLKGGVEHSQQVLTAFGNFYNCFTAVMSWKA